MTEADVEKFGTMVNESERIQEALKILGYEVKGFKRRNKFNSVLHLRFVGSSFFSGDKSSHPLPPGYSPYKH